MRFAEARTRLNEWTQRLDGKEASTNKTARPLPLAEGRNVNWWAEHDGSTPDWRNGRTVGYLCAYVELGRGIIPMVGIQLSDGYLWPDRAVIRSLLAARCVSVREGSFVLTERGEALVAPFLIVENDTVEVRFHALRGRN